MTPWPAPLLRALSILALIVTGAMAGNAQAQGGNGAAGKAAASKPPHSEEGVHWQDLTPAQREVLKPLERDWAGIPAGRKQKWVELAQRYPNLPRTEQERISQRMNSWASMSPTERGQARLNFQETRRLSPQERQARWEAYQALTPEQRRQLGARAGKAASSASAASGARPAGRGETTGTKSNLVPNSADVARPKAIAPTIMQASPGATTSLMSQQPTPPKHQQPGSPKIVTAPGLVDKTTLLPKRPPLAASGPRSGKAETTKRPPSSPAASSPQPAATPASEPAAGMASTAS